MGQYPTIIKGVTIAKSISAQQREINQIAWTTSCILNDFATETNCSAMMERFYMYFRMKSVQSFSSTDLYVYLLV